MPTLRELPKLTQLTLTSAIGGGGGTGGGGSTVFGLLLAAGCLLGLSACGADRDLTGTSDHRPAGTSEMLSCTVDRASLTLSCSAPETSPGVATFGGQGTKVGLRSSNVSYSGGTGILSADITVQNLGAGPIGTTDGTTTSAYGIKVFFVSGPTAAPTGTVTVNNATGTGTFTAGSQPYFEYDTLLTSQQTSTPFTWQFLFAGGATSFTFSVLVSTDVPAAGAIARWAEEPGVEPVNWNGIGGWGSDGLALFGQYGEVYLRDGGAWSSRNEPNGKSATRGAVAVGPNDITIMDGNFATRHWDGIGWREVDGLAGGPGNGGLVGIVGGSGKTGACAFGFNQKCFNGTTWTNVAVTGSPNVKASTVINGNIVVLTTTGAVWSRDSSSGVWTQIGGSGSGQTQQPGIIFGSSLTSLWTISTTNNTDPVIRYWNGTSWTTQAVPSGQDNNTGIPSGGMAISGTEAYIVRPDFVGHGHVWKYDGVSWTELRTDSYNYGGIWARGTNDLYLAADGGRLDHFDGASWTAVLNAVNGGRAIWALGGSNAILGTSLGEIRRYDGSAWTTMTDLGPAITSVYAVDTMHIAAATGGTGFSYYDGAGWGSYTPNSFAWYGVGGSGPHDFWAVGQFGQIYHLDPSGSAGVVVNAGDLTFNDLYAVWALNSNFAVAVGQGGEIDVWASGSWSRVNPVTGNALRAVSGTSTADVWAVGDGGTIIHYDGVNWNVVASGTGQDLKGVWAASASEVYAVGNNKTVLMYNGVSWSPASFTSAATGTNFYAISGRPGGQAFIAGDRNLRGTR
ncbi:MAG: hypothetical protein JF590_03505 [Gemmatimonadetes bacterium]|nr:hypothetical protein [Gemmatimonadota bacterium]